MLILRFFERFKEKRDEYCHYVPQRNIASTAISLELVACLAGNEILVGHRSGETPYEPDKWTFSCEETLSVDDLAAGEHDAAAVWAKRTIAEEIFGIAGGVYDAEIARFVELVRIWNIGYQQYFSAYPLLGVVKLKLDRQQFIDVVRKVRDMKQGIERELSHHVITLKDAQQICRGKPATVSGLFDDGLKIEVRRDQLQSSSEFRLRNFVAIMNGRPLF